MRSFYKKLIESFLLSLSYSYCNWLSNLFIISIAYSMGRNISPLFKLDRKDV